MSQPVDTSLDKFVCVRCGATVPVAATACPACGLELYPAEGSTEGETRCRVCGAAMSVDDLACPDCGAEVTVVVQPDEEEDVEYICSVCGREVAEDDVVCPHCGADVSEIEEEPDEAAEGAPAVALTVRQLHFLEAAHRLPEAVIATLTPLPGEKLVIPAREPKVGDILIRFILSEVVVSVGGHTEGRYAGDGDAADFIDDVVNDRVIFQFDGDEVEVYRPDEINEAEALDWSYYVWSGPLRNKQTGIDWYKP